MISKWRWPWWLQYHPPGYLYRTEWGVLGAWLGISLVYSFGFFFRLWEARDQLYVIVGSLGSSRRVLREGALMAPFTEVCGGALLGFGIGLCLPLFFIVYRHLSHYQGSKSIYLMRRMKDRSLLWKNCVVVPVWEIIGTGLAGMVVLLFYVGVYLLAVPKGCLAGNWWQ